MDPSANLEEQRELLRRADTYRKANAFDQPFLEAADLDRLIELHRALDEWITRGGFLPEDWAIGAVPMRPMPRRATEEATKVYRELADGLSEMVEGFRLNEQDIPDDYQWLVKQLEALVDLDPEGDLEPEAPDLLPLLEEGTELMLLGTQRRADWFARASRAIALHKGGEGWRNTE